MQRIYLNRKVVSWALNSRQSGKILYETERMLTNWLQVTSKTSHLRTKECMMFDMCRAKPRGKMGVYSPSSHMQKLPSCNCSRISQAADNRGVMWSIFHFFRKLCCTVVNCCQPQADQLRQHCSNQGGRLSKHQHPCALPHPPPVPTSLYYCLHQQQFLYCRDCQHPLLL